MRNWLLSKKYKQHNVILSKQITCLPEEPNKHYCKENRDKSSKGIQMLRKHQHQSLIVKKIKILKKDVILPNANQTMYSSKDSKSYTQGGAKQTLKHCQHDCELVQLYGKYSGVYTKSGSQTIIYPNTLSTRCIFKSKKIQTLKGYTDFCLLKSYAQYPR